MEVEVAAPEVVAPESAVLDESEVQNVLEGGEVEEPTLPSDEVAFEMPEKFAGKSAEEIAKSYMELEKMKAKAEESEPEKGGDEVSKEEEKPEEKEPTKEEKESYDKYVDSYEKNGTLSEAEYAELAEAGYTKEQVDSEIEYREYKKEKALNDVLEPLGGGADKFKEVVAWAQENKTPEQIKELNEALAGAPKLAQQALLKQLYSEADKGNSTDDVLHTNSTQTTPSKGYGSESELFADMNNPAYNTDAKFNKKVMEKLSRTNKEGWSF